MNGTIMKGILGILLTVTVGLIVMNTAHAAEPHDFHGPFISWVMGPITRDNQWADQNYQPPCPHTKAAECGSWSYLNKNYNQTTHKYTKISKDKDLYLGQ